MVTALWHFEPSSVDLGDLNIERRLDNCESNALSEHSEHLTDSEQSLVSSESDDEVIRTGGLRFIGKDKTTSWSKPGIKAIAANAKTIVDAWKLFFPDSSLLNIVNFTNVYLEKMREKYSRDRDSPDTTPEELSTLYGRCNKS